MEGTEEGFELPCGSDEKEETMEGMVLVDGLGLLLASMLGAPLLCDGVTDGASLEDTL